MKLMYLLFSGQMRLEITKYTNDFFTPVTKSLVEEREGTTFSLICELISPSNSTYSADDNLIWVVKGENNSSLLRWV